MLKEVLKANVRKYPMRLMFQDEARFGRITDPKRCWAPKGTRPLVKASFVREYIYAYGAVSPLHSDWDWQIHSKMNAENMGCFLEQIGKSYTHEFIVMIVDGASSHKAKALHIPDNMRLLFLPPYSPELNPVEHVWDELREKQFPNRVFDSLSAVESHLQNGLELMTDDRTAIHSLTAWPWIQSLNMN